MWEAIVAAIATALISTGSAAALSAAKRSSETRDAVLILGAKIDAIDQRLGASLAQVLDHQTRIERIEIDLVGIRQRVGAIESGVADRRRSEQ